MAPRIAWSELSGGPLSSSSSILNPPFIGALAKPYHHCAYLNSITDVLARRDGDVIKNCIDFFTCCRHTLISPNNCMAPVLNAAFVECVTVFLPLSQWRRNRFW